MMLVNVFANSSAVIFRVVDAVRRGPIHVVRLGLGFVELLEFCGLAALVAFGSLFEVVGDGADFPARGLEAVGDGGALGIK